MNNYLHIGGAAKQTGLSPKTIRYYEEIGLVPSPKRSDVISGNGYRLYSQKDIARLQMIKRVRHLGLPLKEVKRLVRVADHGCCPTVTPKLAKLVQSQLSEIDQKVKELIVLKATLTGLSRTSPKKQSKMVSGGCSSPGCIQSG